jgi:hypothetical protein
MSQTIRLASALLLAATLGACDSSPGPDESSLIRLSIATSATPAAAPSGALLIGDPVEYTDGTNTLVISSVEMVVKEVELEPEEDASGCDDGESEDNCEEIESGPFLFDLPLTGGATSVITVEVVPGTYDEFEFKIHKPEDDDGDDTFLADHPDFEGVSIRVQGTWNGAAFIYETDLSAEQELELVPPLVVTDAGTSDITLFIDVGTWFRFSDGLLIDPSTANEGGANESTVENNIEQSFDTFEDDDHDGHDDNCDDGDHEDGGDHDDDDGDLDED